MESGGEAEFFFDTSLGDELDMWPMATFLDFDLQGWNGWLEPRIQGGHLPALIEKV